MFIEINENQRQWAEEQIGLQKCIIGMWAKYPHNNVSRPAREECWFKIDYLERMLREGGYMQTTKTKYVNGMSQGRIKRIEEYTKLVYVGNNWFFGENESDSSDGGWLAMRMIPKTTRVEFSFRRGTTSEYFRSFKAPENDIWVANKPKHFTKWKMERFGWKVVNAIPNGWEEEITHIMKTSELPLKQETKKDDCKSTPYWLIDNMGEDVLYMCCDKHYKQLIEYDEKPFKFSNIDDANVLLERWIKKGVFHD